MRIAFVIAIIVGDINNASRLSLNPILFGTVLFIVYANLFN